MVMKIDVVGSDGQSPSTDSEGSQGTSSTKPATVDRQVVALDDVDPGFLP